MKKQTTNTFTEGLLKDFHPLTVPDNVLTDALNATLITMNGNEMVLQNDMGNGRVESAFLPSGYTPVGIKEYGGIIYIASYNPITNKGQIGSFPSPERNIDQSEVGTTNILQLLNSKNTFTFSGFEGNFEEAAPLLSKVDIFKNNSDHKILRSGDKFGLYFDNTDNTNLLSNYYKSNYDEANKVYRNNLITLSVEVLDSNNNLRDITHQLKRYDGANVIKFDDIISESDRFNSGYFISTGNYQSVDSVNKERDKKAINTYNSKLFGKLFLVGKVNTYDHIESYIKVESYNQSKYLAFYITLFYNFPTNYICSPEIKFSKNLNQEVQTKEIEETYNKETNLYKCQYKILCKIEDDDTSILNYLIIPRQNDVGLIPSKAICGAINLKNIENGVVEISDWRYYYTDTYMQLTWGLEAYPFENQYIDNVRMLFEDVSTGAIAYTHKISSKLSYNGVFTETIMFGDEFKPNKIYLVKITWDVIQEKTEEETEEVENAKYRWMITTPIYNSLYSYNSPDFMNDYIKLSTKTDVRNRLHTININSKIDYTNSQTPAKLNEEDTIVYSMSNEGKLAKSNISFPYYQESNTPYSIIKMTEKAESYTINIFVDIDKKFPFIVDNSQITYKIIGNNSSFSSDNINKYGNSELIGPEQIYLKQEDTGIDNRNKFSITLSNISSTEKTIDQSSTFNAVYKAPSQLVASIYGKKDGQGVTVKNNYVGLYDQIQEQLDKGDELVTRIRVRNTSGGGTSHFWELYQREQGSGKMVGTFGRSPLEPSDGVLYKHFGDDKNYTFSCNEWWDKYQDELRVVSNEFILVSVPHNPNDYNNGIYKDDHSQSLSVPNITNSAYVLWKSNNDEYVYINRVFTNKQDINSTYFRNLYIKSNSSASLSGNLINPDSVTYNGKYIVNAQVDLDVQFKLKNSPLKVIIKNEEAPISDLSKYTDNNELNLAISNFTVSLDKSYKTRISTNISVEGLDSIYNSIKDVWDNGVSGIIKGNIKDFYGNDLEANYYYVHPTSNLAYDFSMSVNRGLSETLFSWIEKNMIYSNGYLLVNSARAQIGNAFNIHTTSNQGGKHTGLDLSGSKKIEHIDIAGGSIFK